MGVSEQKNFKHDLSRVIRREYVGQELNTVGETANIFQVSSKVRRHENDVNALLLPELLLEQDSTIDPKIERLSASLLQALKSRFPYLEAIVVMGSGAHGGGLVRGVVGEPEGDFDWGVIVKGKVPTQAERIDLRNSADRILKARSAKYGFAKPLESCVFINPAHLGPRLPNLDEDMTMWVVNNMSPHDIIKYFHPTVPRVIGANNRLLLLQELKRLAETDPSHFNYLVYILTIEWQSDRSIKHRHFDSFRKDTRTDDLIDKVVDSSKNSMWSPFTELDKLRKSV